MSGSERAIRALARLALVVSLAVVPGGAALAQAPASAKFVLVGDSTMAVSSGWGGAFCDRHIAADAACIDLARPGRSTASYRREGFWDLALAELRVAGYRARYVLIQFGHNDQPGKPGHSTDLVTEFPANLRRFVAEARAAGATPILLTPLTRRQFVADRLHDTLEPWAAAAARVAADTGTPLVDLHGASVTAIAAMGPRGSMWLAQRAPSPAAVKAATSGTTIPSDPVSPMPPPSADGAIGRVRLVYDHTHLGTRGAAYVAAMVAELVARAVPESRQAMVGRDMTSDR